MITLSTALPIHFWPSTTFNEQQNGFILNRKYYHELLDTDLQKLQLTDTVNNTYNLLFKDSDDNLITFKAFTQRVVGGLFVYDIEFTFATLPVAIGSDQRIRIYLVQNVDTFDSTFDSTFDTSGYVYKTDLLDVRSAIYQNLGWGSVLLNYKSVSNYYNIQYPCVPDNYFGLRIPCRFYNERMQETVNEIQLSDNVFATSRTQKFQTYLEPYQLPAYMLKKISAALSHDVTGSVQINGVEYEAADGFEWNQTDPKASFFKGKIWLTDKENFIRAIV